MHFKLQDVLFILHDGKPWGFQNTFDDISVR